MRISDLSSDVCSSDREALSDHLSMLWLTPAMDGLFTGPSADRRRFLDRLVLSIDPAHGRRASDFERTMRSRNRLLSEGRYDPAWVSENGRAARRERGCQYV